MRIPADKNEKKQYQQSDFKEGFITCSLCRRYTDWHCRITKDEGLALCNFTPSLDKDKKGRYIHRLKTDSERNLVTTPKPEVEIKEENLKADSERLNQVYSAFLEKLILDEFHSDNLLYKRGLSDNTIARNLYASVPNKDVVSEIAQELAQEFNLEGVPGFYLENGQWRFVVNYSGFYVPYRDEQGRIVGLQIRKDLNEKPKYIWFSSNAKEKGTSSGAPLHFVNTDFARDKKTLYITEGALKADIINEKRNIGLVAMAGVSAMNPQKLVDSIFTVFSDLEQVVIAFDMDWKENQAVKDSLSSILKALEEKDISVMVADWDINLGKGLDDLLNSKEFAEKGIELIKFINAHEISGLLIDENSEQVDSDESDLFEGIQEYEFTQERVSTPEQQEMDFTEKQEIISPNAQDVTDTFGISWGDFSSLEIDEPENVMFGLCRGNVGQLVASTNLGKTTLMLNLALSICSGATFEPLFNEQMAGKKVLYIDGEATKAQLQADVKKMLESCSLAQRELIKDRLFFVCDEELNDEPLDLVNPEHRAMIQKLALKVKPDLIVVDTMSALADLEDENDNAKVKREIIQPLKTLAKKTDSAVIMLHHTGKFNEGSYKSQDAYKGRGASAFGALSRVVFNLKDNKNGKIELSCSKVKGYDFPSVIIKLDQEKRWFAVTGEKVEKPLSKSEQEYQDIVNFVVGKRRQVKRLEILKGLEVTQSTLTRKLEVALERGDLVQPRNSYYAAPSLKIEQTDDEVEYCYNSSDVVYHQPFTDLAVKK